MATKTAPDPIAAIEAELANLEARRVTLNERRTKAADQYDAAREARKAALSSDPAADLSKHTATVRDLEDEIETLDGVLRDLAEQTDEANERLIGQRLRDERAVSAKTLQGFAAEVEAAAAKLDSALAAVGKAYAALIAAIPPTLAIVDLDMRVVPDETLMPDGSPIWLRDTRDNASPNDLARVILAEGIARACPGAMALKIENGFFRSDFGRAFGLANEKPRFWLDVNDRQGLLPTSSKDAAAALVSDRLRNRADAVLAGTILARLNDIALAALLKPRVPKDDAIEIIATEDFKFRLTEDDFVATIDQDAVQRVATDVASFLVNNGAALRTDTPEGAAAVEAANDRLEEKRARNLAKGVVSITRPKVRDHRDLGVIRHRELPTLHVNVA